MPYCVRCGVELQKNMKACPLCHTEVVLPGDMDPPEGIRAFPDRMPPKRRPAVNLVPSRSFLFLVTFILVVPLLVTLIIDLTVNHGVTWSFYPMASLALLWILIAYPALLRKPSFLQILSMDIGAVMLFLVSMDLYSGPFPQWSLYPVFSLALVWVYAAAPLMFTWKRLGWILGFWFLGTAGFLYAMDWITGGTPWFFALGLPILCTVALVGIIGVLLKKLAHKPLLAAGLFLAAFSLGLVVIDGVVRLYSTGQLSLTWSPILLAIFFPTAGFLFLVHKNPELKAYLTRKFHV